MKIAIFTDSFYPGCGGTEKAVYELASQLKQQGHHVLVCAPKYRKKDNTDYPFPVLRAKSIKLTNNEYYALPGLTKGFRQKLNKFKPDIIHCQSVSPMAGFAIKYAKKNNLPSIMTVHTKFKVIFKQTIKLKLTVHLLMKNMLKKLKKVDKVCTVCNSMVADIKQYGYNGNCTVIRNGCSFKDENYNQKENFAKRKYSLHDQINFLYVGHISKFKNLKFLIDSLNIVKNSGLDFKMLFVGRGNDDKYFKNYCKKLGLENNVIFTGQISDAKLLSSIYANATLYLFPSTFDNDPLTLVEAATHFLPSVTLSGTGASERVVDNVSGFISNTSEENFAKRILEALSDKDKLKKIGLNAQKMIPSTWEKTSIEYINLYNQLLNK